MNRRNFIMDLGIGLMSVATLKSYGDINENWIPVLIADQENTNERIYPLKVVSSMKDQIQSLIDKQMCLVTLYTDIEDLTILFELRRVAGMIDAVKLEKNTLYVKWHLLETSCGEVVRNCGHNLYMVSSGIGDTDNGVVCDEYKFIQFIITSESSWEGQFKQRLV